MKCFYTLFLAVAVTALSASVANASIFFDLLDFDGAIDIVNDDSVGIFVDKGSDADVLEIGDLIQGAIALSPIDLNSMPAGDNVIGLYSLRIKSIGVGGSSLVLEAATGADNVLDAATAAGIDVSAVDGFGDSTGFLIIETSAEASTYAASAFTNGGSSFVPTEVSDNGASWDAVLSAGFDGIDDTHVIFSGSGADITDLTALSPGSGSLLGIAFYATYSVFETSGVGFDHDFLDVTNSIDGSKGGITIVNGAINNTDANTAPNGWAFNDDGDYNINIVPEPMSVMVWGGLASVALLARRRQS